MPISDTPAKKCAESSHPSVDPSSATLLFSWGMRLTPSDAELIARCLADDQDAWRRLVERYSALVHSVPRRYGLSRADADDVFQTVFARLVRRLPLIRDHTRVSAWLVQTASRETWRVRNRGRRTAPIDPAALDPAAPDAPTLAEFETEQHVREALLELDPRCRNLLTALFSESPRPSYDEVAERLGIPVGSLGPNRSRCLEKLGRLLQERGI